MKSGLKFIIFAIFFSGLVACARNDINQGIYEGMQDYNDAQVHPADMDPYDQPPDYDEYQWQREKRLKDDEGG